MKSPVNNLDNWDDFIKEIKTTFSDKMKAACQDR